MDARDNVLLLLALVLAHFANAQQLRTDSDSNAVFQSLSAPQLSHPQDSVAIADTSSSVLRRDSWTIYRLSRDEIRHLPVREVSNYLSFIPGVINLNGALHIRGDRDGGPAYLLDGFNVTSPLDYSNTVSLIPEAIEELEVHTGAFGAEFGRSTGGIVFSRMRTGGENFEYSVRASTDDFAGSGEKILNTNVFGYRDIVLTASGPMLPGVKFFIAGQHNFARDRQPMFLAPFRFDSLRVDNTDARYVSYLPKDQQQLLPGPIEFKENSTPGNKEETNKLQGNVTADIEGMEIHLIGSYEQKQATDGGQWPGVLQNYYRQNRKMIQNDRSTFLGLRFAQKTSPDFTYRASFGYFDHYSSLTDPDFGDNWQLYGDSLANAGLGYTGFRYRNFGIPNSYYTWYGFAFQNPNAPNNKFQKTHERSYQVSAAGSYALSDSWSLEAGISSEWWTLRRFFISNIQFVMQSLYSLDGMSVNYNSDEMKRRRMFGFNATTLYGFDVDGQEVESGYDSPRTPQFSNGYLESVVKDSTYKLTVGVRYERYDLRFPYFESIQDMPYNISLDWPDESKYLSTSAQNVLLPRLSLLVIPNSTSSVQLEYGEYAQWVPLQSMLTTTRDLWYYDYNEYGSGNRYAMRGPVQGQMLKPERTAQYDVGLSLSSNDRRSMLDVRFYYKRLSQLAQLADEAPSGWVLKNDGEAVARGADITLRLKSRERFRITLNYSLSDLRGTESDPRSNWETVMSSSPGDDSPQALHPLEYNEVHRGSLRADLLFNESDGWLLDGFRFTALLNIHSGHNYTVRKSDDLGQASAWNIGVYYFYDPRFAPQVESPNASQTPWIVNLDLRIEREIMKSPFRASISLDVLNALNSRQVENVYPTTGSAQDDGWLSSPLAQNYKSIKDYTKVYEIINLQNRWAYINATGNDLYSAPRQIRVGLAIDY